MIETLAWVLPRPNPSKYIGSFPRHFERKLLNLLGISHSPHGLVKKTRILHPFGGMAEFGIRMDINRDLKPAVVGDAHHLPFKDKSFDIVILDPPYSEKYSERLYQTSHIPLKFRKYTSEAVRVLKEEGYLVMYHYLACPSIKGTILVKRIFLENRVWHKLRCIHIHQKFELKWKAKNLFE